MNTSFEHANIEDAVTELISDKMRAFCDFLAAHWGMTPEDAGQMTTPCVDPIEFSNGHNYAMKSTRDALEFWLDEGQYAYGRQET